MTHVVIVSEQAMNDIVRNASWWADHHSPEQALIWYEAILADIYELKNMPASNPIARESDAFDFELRERLFGLGSRPGYRVLFTIGKENSSDAVHVLTIKAAQEDDLHPDEL